MNVTTIGRLALGSAATLLAVSGLGLATAGPASAASASSYTQHSQDVSVGTDPGDGVYVSGNCGPGYHVRGGFSFWNDKWEPDATLDKDGTNGDMGWGKSIAYNKISGGDQDATYQGFAVWVYNGSWFHTETTRVNWTCDPN